MAEIVEKQVTEHQPEVVQTEVVRTTHQDTEQRANTKAIQVVYYLLGLLLSVLGIRFILQLLGASQASGFVDFIYSITEPLVAPFYGVFQTTISYGTARLELETLLAMLVYAIAAWGIANLFRLAR